MYKQEYMRKKVIEILNDLNFNTGRYSNQFHNTSSDYRYIEVEVGYGHVEIKGGAGATECNLEYDEMKYPEEILDYLDGI